MRKRHLTRFELEEAWHRSQEEERRIANRLKYIEVERERHARTLELAQRKYERMMEVRTRSIREREDCRKVPLAQGRRLAVGINRWSPASSSRCSAGRKSPLPGNRITARAFFVAERINTAGLERSDVLSTAPLAFRVGDSGVAVLFRYGVVVLIGLNALEEDEFMRGLEPRMTGAFARREEERAFALALGAAWAGESTEAPPRSCAN